MFLEGVGRGWGRGGGHVRGLAAVQLTRNLLGNAADTSAPVFFYSSEELGLDAGFQPLTVTGTKPGVAAGTVRSGDLTQGNWDLCEPRKGAVLVIGVRGWLSSWRGKASLHEGPKTLGEQVPRTRVSSLLV